MFNFRSNTPIDMESAAHIAPAIFSPRAHQSRSKNYAYIPTHEIVNKMHEEGFKMFSISQALSKNTEKNMAAKHVIRFRHANTDISKVNDEFFEVCLMNSHDGTTSLQVLAGMFRVVCSNGLVIGTNTYDSMKVYHRRVTIDSVIEQSTKILHVCEMVNAVRNEWSGIELDYSKKNMLAKTAHELKYGDRVTSISPDMFLTPRRVEDRGNDLWTVFNVIQENLINGGITAHSGKRSVRTRGINNIYQNVTFNQSLWNAAEELTK